MTIQNVTLDTLEVAPENPRKSVSPEHIDRLAANIEAFGLKQNLVGYDGGDGVFYVTAGGCRLLALKKIGMDNVPVLIEERDDAVATALAENVVRAEMDVVDRVRAWRSLHAEGYSAEQIIKAFTIPRALYDRTMKLASLPDDILDALKDGELTFDHAAAFTVAEPAEAERVFLELRSSDREFGIGWGRITPQEIKQQFVEGRVHQRHRLARFVGRDAYEKAGGTVTEDLFGDQVFFDDAALLGTLAHEELEKHADTYRHEWAWAEAQTAEFDFDAWKKFGRVYPDHQNLLSEAEIEEYDALAERANGGEALSEEDQQRLDLLSDREDVPVWSAEQQEVAGVVVGIGYDGRITTVEGLVKPEDCERAVELGVMQPDRHQPEKKRETDPEVAETGWPRKVIEDVREIRRWALRAELVDKPQVCLKVLAYDFGTLLQTTFSYTAPIRSIQHLGDMGLTVSAKLEVPESISLSDAMAMNQKSMNQLLAVHLALRLADPAEHAVEAIGCNLRKWWTPTEKFFHRLGKEALVEILCYIGAGQLRQWDKAKKSDLVHYATVLFSGDMDRALKVGSQGSEQDGEKIIRAAVANARRWTPRMFDPAEPEEHGEADLQSEEREAA